MRSSNGSNSWTDYPIFMESVMNFGWTLCHPTVLRLNCLSLTPPFFSPFWSASGLPHREGKGKGKGLSLLMHCIDKSEVEFPPVLNTSTFVPRETSLPYLCDRKLEGTQGRPRYGSRKVCSTASPVIEPQQGLKFGMIVSFWCECIQ